MCSVGYAPAVVKWDNTCHSQHHGTEPPVHFCCSHYIFHVFFLSPFISPSLSLPLSLSPFPSPSPSLSLSVSLPLSLYLSLSPSSSPFLSIYVSLWLQDTCHMMPFTKQHSAYAWLVTCILFLINLTFHNLSLHSSFKIHQPFTDYFLPLPYSELLEKRLFRSGANRRLVWCCQVQKLRKSRRIASFSSLQIDRYIDRQIDNYNCKYHFATLLHTTPTTTTSTNILRYIAQHILHYTNYI